MKILTLNLKATDREGQRVRYAPLVGLLWAAKYDVVMFQEGCGGLTQLTQGILSATKDILKRSGEEYHRTVRTMTHWSCWPFIHYSLVTASKIIPERVLSSNLGTRPGAPDLKEKFLWSSGSRALAVLINQTWFANVHLDYTQGETGWNTQAAHLADFILDMRVYSERIVIAGDFNADPVVTYSHNPIHSLIQNLGYNRAPTGCTFGYHDNHYSDAKAPSAPDSIYVSPRMCIRETNLVLNRSGSYVSDHVGVEAVVE